MSYPEYVLKVLSGEILHRLVPDVVDNFKQKGDGTYRVTSSAFGDGPTSAEGPRRPSVYREKLCGSDPRVIRRNSSEYVVALAVQQVRSIDIEERKIDVVADPRENSPVQPGDLAHALVQATPDYLKDDKKFKILRKRLAKAADNNWVVWPPTDG